MLPPHMLDAYVSDYAKRISENAPITMASIKSITHEIAKEESEQDLDRIAAEVKECCDSKDYIEGRRAFMEKRKPDFIGA